MTSRTRRTFTTTLSTDVLPWVHVTASTSTSPLLARFSAMISAMASSMPASQSMMSFFLISDDAIVVPAAADRECTDRSWTRNGGPTDDPTEVVVENDGRQGSLRTVDFSTLRTTEHMHCTFASRYLDYRYQSQKRSHHWMENLYNLNRALSLKH